MNQPGAGSNITAAGLVAASPADGYTLLVVSTGLRRQQACSPKSPMIPSRDFAPISIVAVSPNVVSVHPSVPAKTMQELIEVIKANPGKYSFAAPGDRQHAASVRRDLPSQLRSRPAHRTTVRRGGSRHPINPWRPHAGGLLGELPPAAPQINRACCAAWR